MAVIAPNPFLRYFTFTSAIKGLAGGYIKTTESGLDTPDKATYTTSLGDVALPNPILLDSDGSPVDGGSNKTGIFLAEGAYRFKLYDADDTLLDQRDGVVGTANETTVASMAALRAEEGGGVDYIYMANYFEGVTGGGGHWYWDADSTATDNTGTVVKPNSAPATGRWLRIYSGSVNVLWFGMESDGTGGATNSAIMQEMMTAAQAGDYSAIYYPEGTYQFLPITGEENGTTCMMWASTDAETDFQLTPLPIRVFGDGGKSKIQIYNAAANAIWMSGPATTGFVDAITVDNLYFTSTNITDPGRYTTMTYYGRAFNLARMRRCNFTRCTFNFVKPFFQVTSGEDSIGSYIQQIQILNCVSVRHQDNFIDAKQSYSCNIENNQIEAGNGAIKIGRSDGVGNYALTIARNTIQSNGSVSGGLTCGIRLNFGYGIDIIGNYFESNRQSAAKAAQHILINNQTSVPAGDGSVSSALRIEGNFFSQGVDELNAFGSDYYHVVLDDVFNGFAPKGNTFLGGNGYFTSNTSTGKIYSEDDIFIPAVNTDDPNLHAQGIIAGGGISGYKMVGGVYQGDLATAQSGDITTTFDSTTIIGVTTTFGSGSLVSGALLRWTDDNGDVIERYIATTPGALEATVSMAPGTVATNASFEVITLVNAADLQNIKFPAIQVPSSDVNTLDDYEEGDWTPVIADAASAGNVSPTTADSAAYTKIGRFVTVSLKFTNIDLSGSPGALSGNMYIRNLPFTSHSDNISIGAVLADNLTFAGNYVISQVIGSVSYIILREITSGAGDSVLTDAAFDAVGDTTDLQLTVTYFV